MTERFDSDPTMQAPSGTIPGDGAGLMASLSEIDAMARKAARGAGYPWGLAEEAGFAVRALAAFDLPGPQALADVLEAAPGCPPLRLEVDLWRGAGGVLCPVALGAAISDLAPGGGAGFHWRAAQVRAPLLILPALLAVARDSGAALTLATGTARATALANGHLQIENAASLATGIADIEVFTGGSLVARPLTPGRRGLHLDARTWGRLERLAARTYVPASSASRQSGAGAGTLDND